MFEKCTMRRHFPIEYLNMGSQKITAFTVAVGKHKKTVICCDEREGKLICFVSSPQFY